MAEEFSALVIEDDADSAAFTRSVLERHTGMPLETIRSASSWHLRPARPANSHLTMSDDE